MAWLVMPQHATWGHDHLILYGKTHAECLAECINWAAGRCASFDWNPYDFQCHLSRDDQYAPGVNFQGPAVAHSWVYTAPCDGRYTIQLMLKKYSFLAILSREQLAD